MKGSSKKRMVAGLLSAFTLFSALPEIALIGTRAENVESVPEGAVVGETIYENNFESQNISDWTTTGVGVNWAWNADMGTAELSDNTDGLRVQALNGMKAVALPKTGTEENFVYSAKIKVLSDSGSFGLLTEIKNPLTKAIGATHFGLYIENSTNYGLYQYTRTAEEYYNSAYANQVSLLGDCVSKDDTCTLTVYNILDTTYFYVNGTLVTTSTSYYSDMHYDGLDYDSVGLYAENADILVTSVSVKKLTGISDALALTDTTVRYADAEGYTKGAKASGLRFSATIDKTSSVYKSAVPSGTYDSASENVKFGMLILPTDMLSTGEYLTVATPMVLDVPMDKIESQTSETCSFSVSLLDIPKEHFTREFTARVYMKVKTGDTWKYTYSRPTTPQSFVKVGNVYYDSINNELIRARLDRIFAKCNGYYGRNADRIKFSLFADFHYRENVYMSSVQDIKTIVQKAHDSDADFVLHMGDFCNTYGGSPEIINAYKNNEHDMPVYGIYGNHELEGADDTMSLVTPALTNRADNVVWGTESGKIEDGSIAYYYFDVNGIRVVCTDTNYGWHTKENRWVHREKLTFKQTYFEYKTDSSGNFIDSDGNPTTDPAKYVKTTLVQEDNALGEAQRNWLRKVLTDAAEKDMSCIVLSHHALDGQHSQPPKDAVEVRNIFKEANQKRAGTVLMVLNGHLHTDSFTIVDDILYFDVNCVRNGSISQDNKKNFYGDEITFPQIRYDDDGNPSSENEAYRVNQLKGNDKQTMYYTDPLSTIVTVSSSGLIQIEGMYSTWLGEGTYNPYFWDNDRESHPYTHPWISSGVFEMPAD